MKKKIMAAMVCLAMILSMCITSQKVYAEEICNDVKIIKEIDNPDGTLTLVICDNEGIKNLKYYPVETISVDEKGRTNIGLQSITWGTPSTSYYDASFEKLLKEMATASVAAVLTYKFGLVSSLASSIASVLIKQAVDGQKTVWLGRKLWLSNDYMSYKRQDTYYSDSSYTKVMYKDSERIYKMGY